MLGTFNNWFSNESVYAFNLLAVIRLYIYMTLFFSIMVLTANNAGINID